MRSITPWPCTLALTLLAASAPFVAAAAEKPGIELSISVSGARVVVDGEERSADARSKLLIELGPGPHTVRVEKDGFTPFQQQVVVQAGPKLQVSAALLPLPVPASSPVATAAEEALPTPGRRLIRVAVYDLASSDGVEPRTARIVTEAVVAEIRKLEQVSVIGYKEIQEMISFERQRELLGCAEVSCLAEIAGALGVDELVSGNLGSLGGTTQFNLRRIDIKKGKVRGAVTRQLVTSDGEELLGAVGPAVEQLYPDQRLRGDRRRGVSTEVVRKLNPPPLPAWAFYGSTGLTVIAAGAAGYFGLSFLDEQAQYDELIDRSMRSPVPVADLTAQQDRVESRSSLANSALIVAAGLAVITGVEYFFTDFQGLDDAGEEPGDAAPGAASVRLQPAGLALTF